MMRKLESLINGASIDYPCQSCENMKGNLRLLRKELLAKNAFIKSLLETQTKLKDAILNSISNLTSKPVSLVIITVVNVGFKIEKKIWKIKQIKISIKSTNPRKSK